MSEPNNNTVGHNTVEYKRVGKHKPGQFGNNMGHSIERVHYSPQNKPPATKQSMQTSYKSSLEKMGETTNYAIFRVGSGYAMISMSNSNLLGFVRNLIKFGNP